ncbi:flavin-containing monooxygenase [Rhodococcus wratislaviensis]|uniref:4-hydroxybenzoate brominase (decarboxylating) n=1 Tax=Rhodococcus wratislaviensis NBRC 100605 TaxID=1219028 RepID=X0R3T3_RHOWR|nr:NAD(P)-binding domain-containing protein [Rhodococcus wratislaviensis]GAF45540.1 putative flavin-binding monooxygenase [Rhodococcus wratislaviensis NBRC 100605]
MRHSGNGRVAIIGAGVSGIAALRQCRQGGIDAIALEATDVLGGLWVYSDEPGRTTAYKSLHAKGTRVTFPYPDMPMSADTNLFPSWADIVKYLNEYVDRHDLRESIRFNSKVERVTPNSTGWQVQFTSGDVEEFSAIIVATGHLNDPRWPEPCPGVFNGEQIHSHSFQNNLSEAGKRTLIVGAGNSAIDIASDISWVTDQTFLSTRRGFHLFPETLFGRPRMNVMDRPLQRLPRPIRQWAVAKLLRMVTGGNEKYGIPQPSHGVLQARATVSDVLLTRINHGHVKVKPGIERFDGDYVCFVDGTREKVDRIIWATGYRVTHTFLDEVALPADDQYVPLYLEIFPPDVQGLYFIGLLQPVGATPPVVFAQAEIVAAHLRGEYKVPRKERMYEAINADAAERRKTFIDSPRHAIEVEVKGYLNRLSQELGNADGKSSRRAKVKTHSWS